MLNRVKTAITDSSAYRTVSTSVSGLFHSTNNANIPVEHTRFKSATELSAIATAIDALDEKRQRLTKIAESSGDGSNEYATCEVIANVILMSREKIEVFNASPYKPTQLENMEEMLKLTGELKGIINISDDDNRVLESMTLDKPYAKNVVVQGGLFALPALPLVVFGPGILVGGLALAGYALAKPANDYLTSSKVIDWDTESKSLIMNFIDAVDTANKALDRDINRMKEDAAHNNILEFK